MIKNQQKEMLNKSEMDLINTAEKHRLNSHKGEITRENYLRIDNTNLSADEVARIIKDTFHL